MTLGELLAGESVPPAAAGIDIAGIEYDSRKVSPGTLFFAFPGANVDGHQFVPAVLEAGAAAIASERPAPAELRDRWVQVRHGREALAVAALRFYGRPDRRVALTGVTGTNGKTTTVFLIDSVLREAGFVTARLGTIEHRVAGKARKAVNTTPE
jgi:UDP-N-acetylmuramoyl-L-alanyl-D-glutamate--2,6-diaminopimelate ligase